MKGTRKYRAFMYTITLSAILAGLSIMFQPENAVALIASIAGLGTATMTPFVFGNNIENKADAGAYNK